MSTTIDRKLKSKAVKGTIDRKLKFSAKYLNYARQSGCLKFLNDKTCASRKLKTLDKNLRDKEVVKYLFETSNWFLFERNHKYLDVIDTFSQ